MRIGGATVGESVTLPLPGDLAAIDEMTKRHPDLDVIFIESGGDNLAATFSPDLADISLYVISVCQGEEIPRKGGPGITRSDFLIINKSDLAPYVNVDISVMDRDAARMRTGRPYGFTDLSRGRGLAAVIDFMPAPTTLTRAMSESEVTPVAPGFAADCVETLEEVGMGLAETFKECGGENFSAVPCLNDQDQSVFMLETIVRKELAGWI